jgi:hypothetical protein
VGDVEGIATTPLRPAMAPVPATGWRPLGDLGGHAASAGFSTQGLLSP